MAFVKVVKNKAYFMRFQTKFKRRREGKTDYFARKRLVIQDKDKFNTAKYRLVARVTSSRIIAQIIYATIKGDRVFCAAESSELRRFGLTAGLTNYASAYATGLLLARRLLKKVNLDGIYAGNAKVQTDYDVSKDVKEKNPFKVILDLGLRASTTGSKVFSVLKGVADGGVAVPHSTRRFPGNPNEKKANDEARRGKLLRERILGIHVDNYMKKLKGTEKESLQFNKWLECLKSAGVASVEKLYTKIHKDIRTNPEHVKRPVKDAPKREHTKFAKKRLNAAQRRDNVRKRIQIRTKELAKINKKK